MRSTDVLSVRTPWRIERPVDRRDGGEAPADASRDEDEIAATAANLAEGRRILAWFGLSLASPGGSRIDEMGFLESGSDGGPAWSDEVDSDARPWM